MAKKENLPIFEVEFLPGERRLLERRDDAEVKRKLAADKRQVASRRDEDQSQSPAAGGAARKTKKTVKAK